MVVRSLPPVLIVDDSEGVCLAVSMMLEKSGFRTQTARTLEEGRRAFQQREFGIVLLDRLLGTESGLALAREFVKSKPEVHIVMISGAIELLDEIAASPDLRRVSVLHKPFSRQELVELLLALIERAA